ncbi:MAG: M20 family metallopeptidase [Dehalococcoidia bacterium]|nr:M20 family metallopeptidase [Dehalococcoidia bacterium]
MSDTNDAKEQAHRGVTDAADELIDVSRRIHANPELAMEERQAAALLSERLEAHGFQVERNACGLETAFRASWGEGPVTIAYLCEYDALPEIGHACGHNLIATAGLGAAYGLKAALSPSQVRLLVVGTPAEEGGGGKVIMLERGAFEGVDVALMAHPSPVDIDMPPMYGVQGLEVEYRGQAAHASFAPEMGINALDGLITAYQAIAQLRQHIRRDARIHGIITYGGAAPNVVPDRAAAQFLVRALRPSYLEELKGKVQRCFEAGAAASGASLDITWRPFPYQPMRNNTALAGAYRANAESVGRTFIDARLDSTGSSDMGNVSQALPSIHPMFGVGAMAFNHTPAFTNVCATDAAHASMVQVAQALAMTGVDVALDADLLQRAKDEFASGRGYP